MAKSLVKNTIPSKLNKLIPSCNKPILYSSDKEQDFQHDSSGEEFPMGITVLSRVLKPSIPIGN